MLRNYRYLSVHGNKTLLLGLLVFVLPGVARAHCDGMDGPVVTAAREALRTGNVKRVLIWVQPADEGTIRQAFERAQAVRTLGPEARELADLYFFETLVRIHRAEEGAPYTGLKPAGRDLGPAIPAADRALSTGSTAELRSLVTGAVVKTLEREFHNALAHARFDADDVTGGREFVSAYVRFVHTVEGIYEATFGPAGAHPGEEQERLPHAH